MAVYIVTGKLGNGKTLVSVGRIRDKLATGCIVATNLDLDLVAMLGMNSKKCRVLRVPDKPSSDDLDAIGNGNPTYDESRNGLLVLDECGTWFNSRNWQDKSRKAVNDWFLHARKLGWDVMLIVQDISLVDSQAREAIAEHTVFCRRLDNLHIPVVGTIYKACTGDRLRLPRVHVGKVVYGTSTTDALSDRWVYRGTSFFTMYDTKQLFLADYPHGVFSCLTPWHTKGRYSVPRDWSYYMRITRIVWKRFRSPIALGVGALLGMTLAAAAAFGFAYRDLDQQRALLAAQVSALSVPGSTPAAPVAESTPPQGLLDGRSISIRSNLSDGRRISYVFRVADAAGHVDLSTSELSRLGYTIKPVNQCMAEIEGHGKTMHAMCRAPEVLASEPSESVTSL